MKRVFLVLLLAVSAICSKAQYSDFTEERIGTLKLSTGYTVEFPGMGGYSVIGEYSHSLGNSFEIAVGAKRMLLSGYPRTASVKEFTKVTTMDAGVNFLPLQSGPHVLRAGISFSVTYYQVRRSYPVIVNHGAEQETTWPSIDEKGQSKGFNIMGEYEYRIPESAISLGLRAGLYKAYERVKYIGPFVAVRL